MARVLAWLLLVAGFVAVVVGVLGLVLDWGGTSESDAAAPSVSTTTTSATTTSTTTTRPAPPPEEAVDGFVAQLAAARRSGDSDFLLRRLHPVVIERYGLEQCRDFVAGIGDPTYQLEITSVGPVEPWPYTTDDRSTTIADTTPVTVTGTLGGQPSQAEFHFARVDREFRYFVDCGTPVAAS